MEQTPGAGVVTVNEPREDDSREIALSTTWARP